MSDAIEARLTMAPPLPSASISRTPAWPNGDGGGGGGHWWRWWGALLTLSRAVLGFGRVSMAAAATGCG
eukprot:6171899-Pleurochrysis_carterae.AAC.1